MDKLFSNSGLATKILNLVFISRGESSSKVCIESIEGLLGMEDAGGLYDDLYRIVDAFLLSPGSIDGFFEENFSEMSTERRNTFKKIVAGRMDHWREAAGLNNVSLPRYVDTDWAVHVRKSSAESSNIGTPAVLMELSIENQPTVVDKMPSVEKVGFELSREKLETVLDGFYRIREQLGRIAQQP